MADFTEETKTIISYYTENSDWFYKGWFYGWFDHKSTPSYIEETKTALGWTEEEKNTIDYIEETKNIITWTEN